MSIKISELTEAISVGSSDVLPIVQSGTTKKVAVSTLVPPSPTITYGTTDLTPGVSELAEGTFYFVYE